MKKAVQSPIYFRYEFSDETGRPEGGDIFGFSSIKKLEKMLGEVLDVAQNDGVTVSLTVGQADHFFNYLKNSGLSQKEISKELVDVSAEALAAPAKASKAKKASAKKAPKKAKAKSAKSRKSA